MPSPNESLKLISMNIWGGKIKDPLLEFFARYSNSVDIFCLQEVFNGTDPSSVQPQAVPNIYSLIAEVLKEHEGYFALAEKADMTGLATFVRRDIPVKRTGDLFVYRWRNSMEANNPASTGRNLQYSQFDIGHQRFTVANMHGLWNGEGKTDTPDRIRQAVTARKFIDSIKGPRILSGDFNLLPNTESLWLLETGMRNLIKEYGITSTRTELYTKPERFADYVIVSPEVDVKDFQVLHDVVSDHSPLYLEFH